MKRDEHLARETSGLKCDYTRDQRPNSENNQGLGLVFGQPSGTPYYLFGHQSDYLWRVYHTFRSYTLTGEMNLSLLADEWRPEGPREPSPRCQLCGHQTSYGKLIRHQGSGKQILIGLDCYHNFYFFPQIALQGLPSNSAGIRKHLLGKTNSGGLGSVPRI
jgi:hypothetical protein